MTRKQETITHQKYPVSVKHGKPRLGKLKNGWQRVQIGDLVKEIKRPVDMEDNKFYTLVTVKRSRGGVVKRENLKGKNIAVKTQFFVKKGDFLISKRQIVHGACGFVPKELDGAIVSNEYLVLKCNDLILPSFLNYLKDTIYFQQVCFHSSIGVHVEKMLFKVSQWYRWKIDIPKLEDQKKIASFLDSITLRINRLHQKRELLEIYKKGVMQKIFSQQIRFPKYNKNWEQLRIENIALVSSGGTPSRTEPAYWNGDIPWVTTSEIGDSEIFDSAEKITKKGLENSSAKIFKKNTILMAMYGQGKTRGQVSILRIDATTNQACAAITLKNNDSPEFVYYFLFKEYERLRTLSNDGSQKNLSAGLIKQYKIPLTSVEEQEKIASFLDKIKQKIEAVALQIEKMEEFKKGLLQKMFI